LVRYALIGIERRAQFCCGMMATGSDADTISLLSSAAANRSVLPIAVLILPTVDGQPDVP